ncbi:MAG: signal peptidase I [Verrucomicrobiae bacterium]|nr:signal peptidase I [Verrucomicrobiae bacterium]
MKRFRYLGPSMEPTLQTGDLLMVLPYDGRPVRAGDIVVFRPGGQKGVVVHRVSRVAGERVWTRGDNSGEEDPWVLEPAEIIGQVVSVRRGERTIAVSGGRVGQFVGFTMRLRLLFRLGVRRLLRPVYRLLCRSRRVRRLCGFIAPIRVVQFRRAGGDELVLFLGNRGIGCLRQGDDCWRIRAPFRLVVDEQKLPAPAKQDRPS